MAEAAVFTNSPTRSGLECTARYRAVHAFAWIFLLVSLTAQTAPLIAQRSCAETQAVWPDTGAEDSRAARELGSIGKLFTAVSVLRMRQQQAFDLDAGVPALSDMGAISSLSWRQLLRHENALFDYTESTDFQRTHLMRSDDALNYALQKKRYRGWHYSNSNYLYAGAALQQLSGQPFEQFISQQIAEPLQLTSLQWTRCAGCTVPSSDMGLLLSAQDALRFICALFDDHFLSSDSRHELLDFVAMPQANFAYGLGIARRLVDGKRVYYHSGATVHIRAGLYYSPETRRALFLWQERGMDADKQFEKRESIALQDLTRHTD